MDTLWIIDSFLPTILFIDFIAVVAFLVLYIFAKIKKRETAGYYRKNLLIAITALLALTLVWAVGGYYYSLKVKQIWLTEPSTLQIF